MVITLNSLRKDVTSVERHVGEASRSLTHDVANAHSRVSTSNHRWSRKVHLRQVSSKCKYDCS